MKCFFIRPRFLCLLAGIVLWANPGLFAEAEYIPVKQLFALETNISNDLKHLMIKNPRVTFRVKVAPGGEILDSLAVEATHYGLLPKAEEKLTEARFEPALLNGEPAIGRIVVTVTFFDPEQRAWKRGLAGAPQGGTVSDAVERRQYEMHPERFSYAESDPNQLDTPLRIVESKLCLIHPPDEPIAKGRVLVEYAVDHKGEVHLPQILSSDDEYLTLSVLETLKHTRFDPPKSNGRPTFVTVRQPFNFD